MVCRKGQDISIMLRSLSIPILEVLEDLSEFLVSFSGHRKIVFAQIRADKYDKFLRELRMTVWDCLQHVMVE